MRWKKALSVGAAVAAAATIATSLAFLLAPTDISAALAARMETFAGRKVTFPAGATLQILPSPQIVVDDITFAGAPTPGNVPLLEAERLTAKLQFWPLVIGQIRPHTYILDNPHIRVFRDDDGAGNLDMYGDGAFDAVSIANPRIGTFILRNGRLDFEDRTRGRRHSVTGLDATIDWPRFLADVEFDGAATVFDERLVLTMSAARPVNMLFGVRSSLTIEFDSRLASGSLVGSLRPGATGAFSGAVQLSTPDLPELARWAGTRADGRLMPRRLGVNGDIDIRGATLALGRARLEFGDQAAEGALTIDLSRPLPSVKGTLAFQSLALDRLLSQGGTDGITSPGSGGTFEVPETPAAVLSLDQDIDLRVSAATIAAGRLSLANVALALIVKDGRADLGLGTADVAGGTMAGDIIVERQSPDSIKSVVSLSTRNVAVSPALTAQLGLDWVEGPLDAEATLATAGSSWRDLRTALAGSLDLSISGGILRLPEDVHFATTGLPGVVGTIAEQSLRRRAANLPFTRLAARIVFADRLARFANIRMDGESVSLDGEGVFHLDTGAIDIDLVADPAARNIPVAISGTLGNPAIEGDLAALSRLLGPR